MERLFSYLFIFLFTTPVHAGNGFYYGFDALSHSLETYTQTEIIFTPPPPAASISTGARDESFTDYGFRLGYKYKRRKTHHMFLSPEFYMSSFDPGETIYGTNLKIGYDSSHYSIFGVIGISRVDFFDKNTPTYGAGVEYNISDTMAINIEWQRFDSTDETTTASENFGAQTITTITDTQRDIDVIKLGISFYFHE